MKLHYLATKTRSNRPGWSVIFKHPKRSDSRGKPGLKIRKGLRTQDDTEADRLVAQLNTLLADERWWSADRRMEAAQQFDPVVISAFFDGMEAGKHDSLSLREGAIPLPGKEDDYSRILFTGTTGAGKTTLLRHVIGSRHAEDRFPSTSTARTTTAEIEIVTAGGAFATAITFMPEHEVRAHIDECIEEACLRAVEEKPIGKIMAGLLAHREQRFRLSYVLGGWDQKLEDATDDEFSFEDGDEAEEMLAEDEAVTSGEITANRQRLESYLERIQAISRAAAATTGEELGDKLKNLNPDDRSAWLELFTDCLHEQEEFSKLALDLMDEVRERFERIQEGEFQHGPTGWPLLWTFEAEDRDAFLRQVRWFSSNHHAQFGRLLTPLVDGVRVRGPFHPQLEVEAGFESQGEKGKVRVRGPFHPQLEALDLAPRWVLLDGEGIGHSAKAASSISTRVTRRFAEADLILIVDNAEQPMQTAPLELLRSIGSSGNAEKTAIAFTHFDLVKGPNLSSHELKKEHVLSSARDAIASIRDTIGGPVAASLENRVESAAFFLGGLDREITKIPGGFQREIRRLLEMMQGSGAPAAPVDLKPVYTSVGLETAFSNAVAGFRNPWNSRLGFSHLSDFPKEHWTRVKALSRRLALGWNNNEYDNLRPVSDLVARLQESISRWLDSPTSWNRAPAGDNEQSAALDPIRNAVFAALHELTEERVAELHRADWTTAFDYVGTGSSYKRADEIRSIYDEAAPAINQGNNGPARDFLLALHRLVRGAVEGAGGRFDGSTDR